MHNQKTILIVDDEKDFRDIITDMLTRKDYQTLEATNGEEGIALALGKHPDLILLDLLMPGVDGMAVFKKIREDAAWGAKVPVIIFTNLSATDEKRVEDMVAYKPAYYLVKSDIEIRNVIKKIEDVLADAPQSTPHND